MSNRSLLLLLILMVIFCPLAIDIFLPALPMMADSLSVALEQMQSSITLYILSVGFGQLFSGPLADRFGRKPVALGGIALYGIAAIMTLFADNLQLHLIARLAQGAGACAVMVAAFSCVRDRYDAIESGVMYSYLNGAICCIPALAPILGDFLAGEFGWRSTFGFIAGYACFAGLIIAILLKETRPELPTAQRRGLGLRHYLPIIKHPLFLFNAILLTLAMAIIIAYVSNSPAWLMVKLGLTRQEFVFWFSINAVLNIIASVTAPKILVTFGPKLTTALGMLTQITAGIMLVAMLNWLHPLAFMIPIMVSSVGFALLLGTCTAQAMAPFGDKAGSASALLGFMQMSGAALVVFLVQLLPLNEIEQLGLLMLTMVPMFVFWRAFRVKHQLTLDAGQSPHRAS